MKYSYLVFTVFIILLNTSCEQKREFEVIDYYNRYSIAPEGDEHGRVFKFSIIDGDSLVHKLERITFTAYRDSISPEFVHPEKITIARSTKDWDLFDMYPQAIVSTPIEGGYIKGDSIFIKNALFIYPSEPNDIMWFYFYKFAGIKYDQEIRGKLIENYLSFGLRLSARYTDTTETIFTRRP